MKNKTWKNILILLIVLLNVGCDQASKKVAREQLSYHEEIQVLGPQLIITKVENTGAFLGMGNQLPNWAWTLTMLVLPIAVLLGLFAYLLARNEFNQWQVVALSFIIGGGIGNLIDRFLYQSVTDFLFIDLGFAHTGIFNMADVSVMTGTIMLLLQYFTQWGWRTTPSD